MQRRFAGAALAAATVMMIAAAPSAQDHPHNTAAPAAVGPMSGLGTHHHKIATTSPEAQRLFDQGLVLVYGFNHGQAIRLFQRAAALDPRRDVRDRSAVTTGRRSSSAG
jgi:hypothetical protein